MHARTRNAGFYFAALICRISLIHRAQAAQRPFFLPHVLRFARLRIAVAFLLRNKELLYSANKFLSRGAIQQHEAAVALACSIRGRKRLGAALPLPCHVTADPEPVSGPNSGRAGFESCAAGALPRKYATDCVFR